MRASRIQKLAVLLTTSALTVGAVQAGTFQFTDRNDFIRAPDNVIHPQGYDVDTGSPSTFDVRVCIVPGTAEADDIAISVQNAVDTWANLVPADLNMRNDDMITPGLPRDFESVLMHELGHCQGLGHPNLSTESSLTTALRDGTKSQRGDDNVFNVDPGVDGLYGSPDDARGDDVNLHYFEPGVNNPFSLRRTVDSSNFTRDVAELPMGDSFVTNADRAVATLPRYSAAPDPCRDLSGANAFQPGDVCQEAVMQQGTSSLETQRALAPDDVATILYARSGLDRITGTADDYRPNLVYAGVSDENCQITVTLSTATSFAFCDISVTSSSLNRPANALSLIKADAVLSPNVNWRYSTVRVPRAVVDMADVAPDTTTVISTSVLDNDVNQEGSGALVASTRSFGGPMNGTVVIEADGTFSYTNTNGSVESDFFIYEVCVEGTVACSHQYVELTIDPLVGQIIFESGFES